MHQGRNLGTLATASGLLFAGAWEAFKDTSDSGAAALFLSAGFITLGAWLTLEILEAHRKREHQKDDQ